MTITIKVLDSEEEDDVTKERYELVSKQIDLARLDGSIFKYEKVGRHLKWYIEFPNEAAYAIWKLRI
jgi:hypothetical protein